jgi:multiple sugar transport system substrate-binding protein
MLLSVCPRIWPISGVVDMRGITGMVVRGERRQSISRRQALAALILPCGTLALLSACGGSTVTSVTGSTAGSVTTSSAAASSAPLSASATQAAPTSSAVATSTRAATRAAAPASTGTSSVATSPVAATSSAVAASGVTTVELIYVSDAGEQPEHLAWMKRFHEIHPDIAIAGSLQPENDAYYSKLIAMVAGGTPPDLAYIHPNFLAEFAAKKLITSLDSFVAQDATVNIADFYQTTLSYFDFGGKHYGLPYYSGPTVTYFNKSLFQKYGVKTPDQYDQEGNWTWQTLLDVAQKLTQGTDPATKTYGYQGIGLSLGTYNAPIWENGGEVWDAGMTKMLLDQPQAADALQFQADLSAKYNVVGGSFVPGTAAMNYGIRGQVPDFTNVHFDLGMAALPSGVKGLVCRNGPNAFCLFQEAKQQQAAFTYANWVTQLEAQTIGFALKRSVPTRQSIAKSGAYEQSLYPWESVAVYQQASEKVRSFPVPSTFSDINTLFVNAFKPVAKGQITALDAMKGVLPAMNADLAKKIGG